MPHSPGRMIRQSTLLACLSLLVALARSTNPLDGELTLVKATGGEDWEVKARLPDHLIPLHYELYLHPDLQDGTFKGLRQFFKNVLGDVNLSLRSG